MTPTERADTIKLARLHLTEAAKFLLGASKGALPDDAAVLNVYDQMLLMFIDKLTIMEEKERER